MEQNVTSPNKLVEPRYWLSALGIILLAGVVIVAILRDRLVNDIHNQVTVYGQGKVEYQPDEAEITLGVQVDKVAKAEEALNQLNEKMNKIISAVETLGVSREEIKTENYSLYPQYDYVEGVSKQSGYNANQQVVITVKDINQNPDLTSKVISAASGAGANQVMGVNYQISDINQLKQEARLKAIADAKNKSEALFKVAGINGKKEIVGWYENSVFTPDMMDSSAYGLGGEGRGGAKMAPTPQIPSGRQEIVIEIGVNYEIR